MDVKTQLRACGHGGNLHEQSLAYITDYETWANQIASLLLSAREYVADSLGAHDHSDGRTLLREIDAALCLKGQP